MDLVRNLDLLTVSITSAATVILGFTVLFSNRKSITNVTFFLFTIITALWSVTNYLYYSVESVAFAFILIKLVIFIAVWHAFTFFQLFYVFPNEKVKFNRLYEFGLIPLCVVTSLLTLTPLVFNKVTSIDAGRIDKIQNGPGIAIFGMVVTTLIILGIFFLVKKIYKSSGELRKQFKIILYGVALTFTLILSFNFIFPAFLDNASLIPLSSVFIFPFILFTSYSILKYRLFNIKVAGVSVLVFALSVVSFLEIIYADNLTLILFRIGTFLLILLSGVLLIKGVTKEVSLREALQKANEGQENLIHIMNHQIKGYLGKARSIFAELKGEPEYCATDDAKPMLDEGFRATTEGVDFIQQVLNSSNAQKGTITYLMKPMDFKNLVEKVVEDQKSLAAEKGLSLELQLSNGNFEINGDELQLREAVRNLIDNSIRYTLKGKVEVSLNKVDSNAYLEVKDTGVGITAEDMSKLFTKGGKGKDSLKYNVNSTGYGLAFVKAVVEAHHGKVHAESKGKDQGSQFYLELPLV